MYFDPLYIGLIVVTLLISGGAQLYIRSTYGRWSRIPNTPRLSGAQVAEFLQAHASFGEMTGPQAITAIKVVPGNLSDHFDPRDRSLGLSAEVAQQPSVAAMAVSAHEVGHAQQHAEGTVLMKLRGVLVPAASFGPNVAYLLIFIGIIFNVAGLVTLGVLFFGSPWSSRSSRCPSRSGQVDARSRCSIRLDSWSRSRIAGAHDRCSRRPR